MTPKQKADELVDLMMIQQHPINKDREDAIRCAKLAAEMIVKAIHWHREIKPPNWNLWTGVYDELKKMQNEYNAKKEVSN